MITIIRNSAYADKIRKYKIMLDGKFIGDIADDQSKSFEVEQGAHSLYLKIDWGRSNKLDFEYVGEGTLEFKCSNSLTGGKEWLAIFYAIFLPYKYLKLERVD